MSSSNLVAVGDSALYNSTGPRNTAIGSKALYSTNTGSENTATGYQAMYSTTTGKYNTANGMSALSANDDGTSNTGIGWGALLNNISGTNNAAIGVRALQTNSGGGNNTGLGTLADVSTGGLTNATAIGFQAIVNASNKIRLGNSAVTVIEGQVAYTFPSDARFKYNIKDDVPGLDFITKLKPVTYYFDEKKMDEFTRTGIINNSIRAASYNSEKQLHTGFLAQDVEKIANELGYKFDGVHAPENDRDHYGIAYTQFIMPLVKSVQQQQKIIEEQNEKINDQQDQIKR